MRERIQNYLRAGFSGLYIVSHEESRVEQEVKAAVEKLKHRLYAWSVSEGIVDTEKGSTLGGQDPFEALGKFRDELPDESILLCRDLHQFLADGNPALTRAVKDAIAVGKTKSRCLILLGCRLALPPELDRELTVLEFNLPGRAELGTVLDGISKSAKLKALTGDERDAVLDSARGLTTTEAENAFSLSVAETKGISAVIVAREKAQALKKGGLLEVVEPRETLDSIGGLEALKEWLVKRRDAFSRKAVAYGLPSPKGLLLLGVPGTGKSLAAKATAAVLGRPLLKLDAGRIFAGLVGQSESNLRSVIQTAEAVAPCVLWLDEIEKGFSGSKSSGSSDGGTASRVFGGFISWMQERKAPVFVIATANDVTQLPPEMLRKGRFDELFFVDLPNEAERTQIWRIQIARYGRDPAKYDTVALARATEGYTGSEIEQLFIEALFEGFAAGTEPSGLSIMPLIETMVPLSRLMGEQIKGLRDWARGRARPATPCKVETRSRRLVA